MPPGGLTLLQPRARVPLAIQRGRWARGRGSAAGHRVGPRPTSQLPVQSRGRHPPKWGASDEQGTVCLRAGGSGGPGSLRAEGLCWGLWGCSLEPGNCLQQSPRHYHSEALPTSGLGRSPSRTDLCCSHRLGCPCPVPRLPAAPSSQLAPSNGRVQVPASLGPLCRALDVLRRGPRPPRLPTSAGCAPLTPTLPPQAAGDMPTTPKHPKDARENVFPVATAPAAPEPTPADAPSRPSDGHAKPRLMSATASTPDPAKDPGPPQLQRPEAAPSTSSLRPGESVPSTQWAGPAGPQWARSLSRHVAAEMWAPPVR